MSYNQLNKLLQTLHFKTVQIDCFALYRYNYIHKTSIGHWPFPLDNKKKTTWFLVDMANFTQYSEIATSQLIFVQFTGINFYLYHLTTNTNIETKLEMHVVIYGEVQVIYQIIRQAIFSANQQTVM